MSAILEKTDHTWLSSKFITIFAVFSESGCTSLQITFLTNLTALFINDPQPSRTLMCHFFFNPLIWKLFWLAKKTSGFALSFCCWKKVASTFRRLRSPIWLYRSADSVSDTKKSDVELLSWERVCVVCLQLLTPGCQNRKGRIWFTVRSPIWLYRSALLLHISINSSVGTTGINNSY